MNPPLKVLLIIPNLGPGGAQQVFRDQYHFYARHVSVTGCVFNWDGALSTDKHPGIHSLDVPAGRHILAKGFYFLKRVYKLRQLKKKLNPDVSISHLEGADYINILSRYKDRIFCWIHGTKKFDANIEGILGILRKRFLIPYLYRKSDLLVTVSEGIKKELTRFFYIHPDKITTINNSFDLEEITHKAKAPSNGIELLSQNRILVTHCRLARQKNISAMVKIFSRLSERERTKLVIVGDGELKTELKQQCVAAGLTVFDRSEKVLSSDTDDIYFMGYQANPFPYLKHADLYLMTSLWEGFPLAICEAMACHIPVMSSDCFTGPREILAPSLTIEQLEGPHFAEYGILMPVPDSEARLDEWAKTIDNVLHDSAMRNALAERGHERMADFERKEIVKHWLRIIHG